MKPPSLLSLSVDLVVDNIGDIHDLSFVPETILLTLLLKIIQRGKLTMKILKLFVKTNNEIILALIEYLHIEDFYLPLALKDSFRF
ncbi:hypothetical protein ZOSMA_5G02580 [Zostera marina]|uniref:FBD domain-containing protein n=1 Tax=Zostera marina TaxID=29655 RepID=A0A0K9NWM4_ZOSMR|nr:hypothetical protein ZOSMA_5G02580 [Zostera marina]